MRVFLTGGTGLVGSHVAERLRAAGYAVRALVRPGAAAAHLDGLGVECHEGDVTRPGSLVPALGDCQAVVHAAALLVASAPWETYRRVNVEGTRNVLRAAVSAGVRRAVHVSSVAVYGGAEIGRSGDIDEAAPRDTPLPPGEVYARSKRGAEEVAWAMGDDLEVVVVRPAVVYGERDRHVVPRLVTLLDRPVAFTVGSGRSQLPLVYAGNVADGICRALTGQRVVGRAYNLTMDFPVTQRELFGYACRALGRRPRLVPVPYGLAAGVAWCAEWLARLAGVSGPALSRRRVSFLCGGNPFVAERARRELGWAPDVTHEEGVRRAIDWHRRRVDPSSEPG